MMGLKFFASPNSILVVVAILLAIGLTMVYSSSAIAAQMTSKDQDPYLFIKRQFLWALIAVVAMLVVMEIPYNYYMRFATWLYLFTIVILIVTLLPWVGTKYNGARRWIRLCGMGVQPSEFAKLAMVIFVASYITKNGRRIRLFGAGFIPIMGLIFLVCFLTIIEPDFGTSTFIFIISLSLLVAGGIKLRHLMPLIFIAIPGVVFLGIYKFGHIWARLHVYLNPECDRLGKGHQITQSLIAIGSGGLFGQGLGQGRQKLFFLPEETTDFIFSIIGEELGFIGATVIIILFVILIYQGLEVSRKAPDVFGSLLALGVTLIIGVQAAFNIAVVTASIPAKGISLPFISFGGSGLFFTMLGIGILLNISSSCCQPLENTDKHTKKEF